MISSNMSQGGRGRRVVIFDNGENGRMRNEAIGLRCFFHIGFFLSGSDEFVRRVNNAPCRYGLLYAVISRCPCLPYRS